MRSVLIFAIICLFTASAQQAHTIGLPVNTQIHLVANAEYSDPSDVAHTADPATLTLNVDQIAGVTIESDLLTTQTTKGVNCYVALRIKNTGNAPDTFDLSAISAHGWAVSLVYDDNADGMHQDWETTSFTNTGMMINDIGYSACFAKVSVPDDATSGDTVTVKAVSQYNSSQGTAVETLNIPQPGKQAVKILAEADSDSPQVGKLVTINGTLLPPIAGKVDVTIAEPDIEEVTSSVNTHADGSFTTSFTPKKAGECNLDFHFDETNAYGVGSGKLELTVAKGIVEISAAASSETPVVGTNLTVSGSISPATQANLTVECTDPDSNLTQDVIATDAQGKFSWVKSISKQGSWPISVKSAESDDYEASSKELSISAVAQGSGAGSNTGAGPASHEINITSGPAISASAVNSGGSVRCSITASDTQSDTLVYAWSDGGAGGTFSPSASVQNPTYTPSANTSGSDVQTNISCSVKCSQDPTISSSGSVQLTVHSAAIVKPTIVSVTPANTITNVALNASVVVNFSKSMDKAATESALNFSPTLLKPVYTWSNSNKTLTITNDGFKGLQDYTCTVAIEACDKDAVQMAAPYTWTFTSTTAASFSPSQVSMQAFDSFSTPHIIYTDPTEPTSISLAVSIPQGVTIDTATSGTGLVCVEAGSDVTSFTSQWDAATRMIWITANVARTGPSIEVVKTIRLTAPSASGNKQIMLDGLSSLLIQIGDIIPGDFNGDQSVTIKDASLFIDQWIRWHASPLPTYSASIDGVYDLAPHTQGTWPSWTLTGDSKIDIKDASAFIECWIKAHNQSTITTTSTSKSSTLSTTNQTDTTGNGIPVILQSADSGVFETSVIIPAESVFDPAIDAYGNLKNVTRGSSINSSFFCEYNSSTRTVYITGDVKGNSPYSVAYIKLSNPINQEF